MPGVTHVLLILLGSLSDRFSPGGVNLVQNVGTSCAGGLVDEVPQKLKQFWISICINLT